VQDFVHSQLALSQTLLDLAKNEGYRNFCGNADGEADEQPCHLGVLFKPREWGRPWSAAMFLCQSAIQNPNNWALITYPM